MERNEDGGMYFADQLLVSLGGKHKDINNARYLINPIMDKTYYYLSKRCMEKQV
jgi:hypothetical protein